MKNSNMLSLRFVKSSIIIFVTLVTVSSLLYSPVIHAWATDALTIRGMTTTAFLDKGKGYISIKDEFDQEFIYPQAFVEKKMNRKISNKESSSVVMVIEFTEQNELHEKCVKDFKGSRVEKKCPFKLVKSSVGKKT